MMAPSTFADRAPATVVTNGPATPLRASRLSPQFRAFLFVFISLAIRSTLLSVSTNFLGEELGDVSRKHDGLLVALAHLGSKVLLLLVGWFAGYDYIDIMCLTAITNAPFWYLLVTYYDVSVSTVAAHANIEILAVVLPTYLLRPKSAVHSPNVALRNRFLLSSTQVQVSTSLLAMGAYVLVLFSAIKSGWLNSFLVVHFDIPTLELAHNETPISLLWKTFVAGIAAREFLFNPSIGAQASSGATTPVATFDAATATLPATVKHNFWNYSKPTRTLIQQTAFLSAFIFVNTLQRCNTLQGADVAGPAGYALVWITATAITAAWWTWVGDTTN
ncbi:hypothetical protein EJ04DRAFT_505165 [Polyplosphaeria fusca]|uniref:Uncharacterized protein n=1 Tax=Polyplosphaeria fusca TaxID=682080 RepID=A0A9P4QMR0_9PLEO|nr:hypothetical protein EJ04DRAFT_505165 [Polyplosphaeria fusca]